MVLGCNPPPLLYSHCLRCPKKNPVIENLFFPLLLQSRHLLRGELNEAEEGEGIIEITITAVQCHSPVKKSRFLPKAQLATSVHSYQGFLHCHHCTIGKGRNTLELPYHPLERFWSHKAQLTSLQATAGEAKGGQHLGDQAQKAAASAPEEVSSAGSAPLPRELTKKLFKNLFKITYSLL